MADETMSKRERVLAALRGAPVDRVPVSFWGHNFTKEGSARDLADETLRIARAFDWDFIKVQSRFSCFAECWGGVWQRSSQPGVNPILVKPVAESVADLDRIRPVPIAGGPLAEQVEALQLLRAQLPDDRPIIMTVFAPLMVLRYCFRDATPAVMAALREEPAGVERALRAIGETLTEFCRACIDAGADGMFYATNVATRDLMSVEEVRRFQRPFDLPILQAIADAPFTMMHVCGEPNHLTEFVDYPVSCFNCSLGPGNLSLVEARELTGKAVVGGVSEKAPLRTMTSEQVGEQARRAIAETGGRSHLLAPGCSIEFDTPAENLLAARAAARGA
ncbi:MAG: hypothetical protein IT307_15410 [Chloroflexi bacterium]|nr:hypothetical protein [Chloroflexota bacterium]